jgi:hypothetical protein
MEGGRETRGPGETKAPHPLVNLACQAANAAKHRVNSCYFHKNLSFFIYFRANAYLLDLMSVSTYTRYYTTIQTIPPFTAPEIDVY